MKMNYSWLGVSMLFTVACSTSDQPDFPSPSSVKEETIELKLRTASSLTRADDGTLNDASIKTVYIAFYKADAYKGKVLANGPDEDGNYTIKVSALDKDRPDNLVAFVNISAEEVPTVNLSQLSNKEINRISDQDGFMVMTSRGNYENGSIVYTPINEDVLTGKIKPEIVVERLAAKVITKWENPIIEDLEVNIAHTSDTRKLKLKLIGWTVSGVEKGTLFLRKNPSTLTNALDFYKWSQSLTWGNNSYPEYSQDVTENHPLKYMRFADVNGIANQAKYSHETTRSESDYATFNSTPVIIITGQYTLDGATTPGTFYKYGENAIFSEKEYWDAMSSAQNTLFKDGQRISGDELKLLVDQVHPGEDAKGDALLMIQLKPQANISGYVDEQGNSITTTKVNENLAKCPVMERFLDGKCYFVVPIRHKMYDSSANKQPLGAFGLVRNHAYTITIDAIKGIGTPISYDNQYLLQNNIENNITTSQVSVTLTVADWDDVNNQKVSIER